MPIAHNLGFPPLGPNRELKRATEGYWSGKVSRANLLSTGATLRAAHWRLQRDAGLDLIPSNDYSYYDRVLDTCAMVGAGPARYGESGGPVDLDTYFARARGVQAGGRDVTAMEMTKWFDTNYHYIVPEFDRGQTFRLASPKPVDEFQEAKALGFHTKPVLIGPVTFLSLGKSRAAAFDRLELLDALLAVYGEVLARLAAAGATWVQLDEPSLALDRTPQELARYGRAYRFLAERAPQLKLLVATYFAGLEDSLATARELPVAGLHVDLVRAPGQLDQLLTAWPKGRVLSLGVIDGRNVWRADLAAALGLLERARRRRGRARPATRLAPRGAAQAAAPPPPLPDDHDRVVPPDGGGARRAQAAARREADAAGIRRVHRRSDRAHAQAAGGAGARRAGARGVRAQRHGRVLRRTASGVRLHRARLGAVVRHAVREAAPHLWGRVTSQADDRPLEHLCAVADREAGEGDAHRPGDHPAVVVRARRPAARRDREAAGAGDPRRGEGSRSGRDPGDPDRRTRATGRPAAQAGGMAGVPRLGGERVPSRHEQRVGRDSDPHAYVLQRDQRRHSRDREDGRGRHLDRERALGLRAAGRVPRVQISQRDRPGGVRYPLAARPELGRDRGRLEAHAGRAARPADLGEPRLRSQDAGLGRDACGTA